MREIRQSGLEGGVRLIPHPYPYLHAASPKPRMLESVLRCAVPKSDGLLARLSNFR